MGLKKSPKLNHPCSYCNKVIHIEDGGIRKGKPLHDDCFIKQETNEIIKQIKEYVYCMNPQYCNCKRCPSCNIFYERLTKFLEELKNEN